MLGKDSRTENTIKSVNGKLYKLDFPYRIRTSPQSRWKPKSAKLNGSLTSINRLLFNVIISFSFQVTCVFLLDVSGFLDNSMRSLDWKITLTTLIVLLSYVVPSWTFQCYGYIKYDSENQHQIATKRFALSYLMVLTIWIVAIKIYSSIFIGTSSLMRFSQRAFYGISVLGISCLAALNGTGCISSIFSLTRAQKHVTKEDISKIVESLKSTEGMIDSRRSMETELRLLESSYDDLVRRLEDQLVDYKREMEWQTAYGRMNRLSELGFSIYCMYRVVTILLIQLPTIVLSSWGVIGRQQAETDPLSTTISRLVVRFINDQYDEDQLSVIINMTFAICLFVCSFKGVVITFSKLSKPSHMAVLGRLYELFVAETTGIYALSTMMILHRGGLPSGLIEGFFGNDQLGADFVNILYTKWFGVSCIVSGIGFGVMKWINRHNSEYLDDWDEEKLV
ncbi:hypothetical protein FOA43_002981 [Brettanomyces nanus]|uniref:Uncharacterized protein n=1 Tax=Eeniella nana TaxID=13502 RepID=A0A875S973_EENNA|nr:uncharacterized protein FOA43_002981 [Brettanomyces nanus]QPG75624.1 hypothetical protein FOA43_002981 [Brettanomyces nanus]